MDGVYGVFSVQPYSANEIQQGVALIEAAKQTGLDEDTSATACPYAFDGLMSRTFKR